MTDLEIITKILKRAGIEFDIEEGVDDSSDDVKTEWMMIIENQKSRAVDSKDPGCTGLFFSEDGGLNVIMATSPCQYCEGVDDEGDEEVEE